MSRPNLIKYLKNKNSNLNNSDLEEIVDIFCAGIATALKNGLNVELRGFGTLFTKKIKEKYSARNPKTGELIYVPEKKKVRFKPSKKLKNYINK